MGREEVFNGGGRNEGWPLEQNLFWAVVWSPSPSLPFLLCQGLAFEGGGQGRKNIHFDSIWSVRE